jgi:hypothetical protein
MKSIRSIGVTKPKEYHQRNFSHGKLFGCDPCFDANGPFAFDAFTRSTFWSGVKGSN